MFPRKQEVSCTLKLHGWDRTRPEVQQFKSNQNSEFSKISEKYFSELRVNSLSASQTQSFLFVLQDGLGLTQFLRFTVQNSSATVVYAFRADRSSTPLWTPKPITRPEASWHSTHRQSPSNINHVVLSIISLTWATANAKREGMQLKLGRSQATV